MKENDNDNKVRSVGENNHIFAGSKKVPVTMKSA